MLLTLPNNASLVSLLWLFFVLVWCLQVAVPQPLVGHIIGKGGTFVREVLSVTNVQASVAQTQSPLLLSRRFRSCWRAKSLRLSSGVVDTLALKASAR